MGCQHCCLAGCRCSPGCALATKLDKEGEGINGTKQLQGVKGLKGVSDMAEAMPTHHWSLNAPAEAFQIAGSDDLPEIAVN